MPYPRRTHSFSSSSSAGVMARGSAPLDGSVLPPSRIMSERQAELPCRFMPESVTGREVVALGEGRPAPHYPGRSVFFLSFAMAGLVPPFSTFFMDVLPDPSGRQRKGWPHHPRARPPRGGQATWVSAAAQASSHDTPGPMSPTVAPGVMPGRSRPSREALGRDATP